MELRLGRFLNRNSKPTEDELLEFLEMTKEELEEFKQNAHDFIEFVRSIPREPKPLDEYYSEMSFGNYHVSEISGRNPLRLGKKLYRVVERDYDTGQFATCESAWSEKGAISAALRSRIKFSIGLWSSVAAEQEYNIRQFKARPSSISERFMVGVAEKLTGEKRIY